jgi:hypothetical protein
MHDTHHGLEIFLESPGLVKAFAYLFSLCQILLVCLLIAVMTAIGLETCSEIGAKLLGYVKGLSLALKIAR